MALIVYNRENSRPQEVTYKGKRTINLDSRGTVYLSKTMSIELGILGGGRVNFAHDDETGDWYICRADDSEGFIVWKDKRCARFSAGFIVQRLMRQAKVETPFPLISESVNYFKEERAVHDGENAGGDWRGSLLQDTALEPDTQIKAWAGGCACFYAPPLRERTVLSIHGPPQFHNDIME